MNLSKYIVFTIIVSVLCATSISALSQDRSIDVVLLMDSSGSMKKTDPQTLRKPAAKMFVSLLNGSDRVSIVSFSDKSYPVSPLIGAKSKKGKSKTFSAVEKISSKGAYTNLHDALTEGVRILDRADNNNSEKILVLMSDGKMDTGDTEKDIHLVRQVKGDLLTKIKDRGIRVYTIAFTPQSDRELLQEISRATNGLFHFVSTSDDLHIVFSSIFENLKSPDMLPIREKSLMIDDSIKELTIIATKESPETKILLKDPDGKELHSSSEKIEWFASSKFDMITVKSPKKGMWEILFSTGKGNKAYIITDLKILSDFDVTSLERGQQKPMKVWMEREGKVINERAIINPIDLNLDILKKGSPRIGYDLEEESSSGLFKSSFSVNAEGAHEMVITARSKTFEREKKYLFNVVKSESAVVTTKMKKVRDTKEAIKDIEEDILWGKVFLPFFLLNLLFAATILFHVKRGRSPVTASDIRAFLVGTSPSRILETAKRAFRKRGEEKDDEN